MACEAFPLHDRFVKASFGTTKYCTNFLKGQQCKIKECVYLHQHPKDKDNTQVLKKEEMNNSKWLFTYSQRLAQNNFRKFYQKINYKLALNKSIFPTTQNILDRMIDQNYVDPIAVVVKEQKQQNIEEIIQQPDVLDKRVEQIIMKMDTTDQSNSRFKFTTGKNIPLDVETINQLKQYVQK